MKLSESKKLAGDYGEEQAALYLKKHGYRIVGRNYKVRTGEIDLIVSDREYIVFVEVKMRKNDHFGEAKEFVGARKQERVRSAAMHWLSLNETELQPRFDVIEIYGDVGMPYRKLDIRHIENAFE